MRSCRSCIYIFKLQTRKRSSQNEPQAEESICTTKAVVMRSKTAIGNNIQSKTMSVLTGFFFKFLIICKSMIKIFKTKLKT
jgi:hypothetical protein